MWFPSWQNFSQLRPKLQGARNCCFFVMTWDKHKTAPQLFRLHWKQVCGILAMQSWKVTSKLHSSLFLCILLIFIHMPATQLSVANNCRAAAKICKKTYSMCCLTYGKTHLKHCFLVLCFKSCVNKLNEPTTPPKPNQSKPNQPTKLHEAVLLQKLVVP